MAKKIKRQIKRSIPLFVIVSLISSTMAIGLVFNFNFDIYRDTDNNLDIAINMQEAQAQDDFASTTVTVLNAAPEFSVDPTESPVSTSSSPVNVGDAISFQATASDAESNSYYLIVCPGDGTASTSGGAPECPGGPGAEFCISPLTAAAAQATCVYNNLVDPPGETDDWYAFVCDNHATEADCSASSQGTDPGTADGSSPFYINHAPVFTSASTTVDNQPPGGSFTVTASTTDSDVASTADELYIYVCSSNSWATSTLCAADMWCSGTSTTPNVSCAFSTTTPAVDGDFSYYVFVKDWHEFASAGNSQTATYTVINVAPTVTNVSLHSGVPIELNMKGMSNELATTTSASISDNNSCLDIVSATSSIYYSAVSGEHDCTADNNNCYKITSAFCTRDNSTCTGASDPDVTYTCSTTIQHFAIPTDASAGNPSSGNDWLGSISVEDDDGAFGVGTTSTGVELNTLTALEVTETEIPYGSIAGGDDTQNINATTTVINYGNAPLDSTMDVTDMIKSDLTDYIGADSQEFATSSFIYGAGTFSIATTVADQQVDTVIPKPTSATDVSDEILWGLGIPAGTTSGPYSGTNTFQATLDDDGWS